MDLLSAIAALVRAGIHGEPAVINTSGRSVRSPGNPVALDLLAQVFEMSAAEWRGFGSIPASGLSLRAAFAHRDAARRFPVEVTPSREPPGCRCGEVLRGVIEPPECALYGRICTPRNPIGPCMVSAEGACAAYYQYALS